MNKKVKMSAPWDIYVKKIMVLFGQDPAVTIDYERDDMTLKIFARGTAKAKAIRQLLPSKKAFGNVCLDIIVAERSRSKPAKIIAIKDAFYENPIIEYYKHSETSTNPIDYVVFKKEVVQFFNDNLGDVNGIESTLYQEVAKEIIGEDEGIFFCTSMNSEGKN